MAQVWEDTYDEAQKRTEDVRRKMFIDSIREKVPSIDPEIAFLTPTEMLKAMKGHPRITGYHERMRTYSAKESEIGLLFPDSDWKPWTKGKTTSLSYRNLFTALKNLKLEERVAVYTISPLLGVVPEEDYEDMPMYDSSGAQSFMVRRRGLSWNQEDFKAVISISASLLSAFLERNYGRAKKWHVIYRNPSVHQRIFETSMDAKQYAIWPHVTRRSLSDSYLDMKTMVQDMADM